MDMSIIDNVFRRYSIAVVTPFFPFDDDSNQLIDFKSLELVLNHTCEGLNRLEAKYATENIIGGIIVSGSTVAAGISATTTNDAMNLAQAAIEVGCQGIMLGLPPYLKLSDHEIKSYILAVHNITVIANIPILLYNNISRNGYGPSNELIVKLCRSNIICGMKYAITPESEFFKNIDVLLNIEPTMKLYTGSDRLSLELMATDIPLVYGLTSIMGNLQPFEMGEVISNVVAITKNVDLAKIQYEKLYNLMNVITQYSLPTGVKYAMHVMNIPGGYCRKPLGCLSESDQKLIKDEVVNYMKLIL